MSLGTSAVNNHLETKGQNSKWSPSVVASSGDKVEDDIDSAESDDDDAVVIGQNYKACQQPKEVGQRKESRSSAGSVYQKEKHAGLGLSSDRTAKSKLIGKENHSGKETGNSFYHNFFTCSGDYEVFFGTPVL